MRSALLGPVLLGDVPAGLLGLGATPIESFLLAHPRPTSSDVSSFLKAFAPSDRAAAAQDLIAHGVDARAVSSALAWLEASERAKSHWPQVTGALVLASAAASAYHGYKRNQSIGWGAWWFFMGSLFPIFTPVIAVAQGFGKKRG
jgi:hypothetical protein